MRALVHAFFLMILIGCSDQVSNDRLVPPVTYEASDLTIQLDSTGRMRHGDELLSGYLTEHYPNGVVKKKTGFFQGLEEGEMTGFYPDGSQEYVRPYSGGKKHGFHKGWYPGGQPKFTYYFENGLSEGNHQEWYENGSLYQNLNYLNGKQFGSQKVWRRDGKVRANYVIRENGRRYGLMGIKRCTKIDGEEETLDPYKGS